ncbi:hypothetical protein ACFRJ1_29705 [Streptomyces sp. NPDC056773]|uniref:hypothetical protein n=1 Tax=unclassified Streptomyces TaxID=2593676 RepID=UPI0036AB98C5
MSDPSTHTVTQTATDTYSPTPAHTFADILLRRLLKPVWNALVIYGTLWLPPGQYRLQYLHGGTVVFHPIGEPTVPVGGDRSQPDLETLRAS